VNNPVLLRQLREKERERTMNVKKFQSAEVVARSEDFAEFVFEVVSVRQGRRGKTEKMLAFIEDKFTTHRYPLQKASVLRQLRNTMLEGNDMDLEIADHVHVTLSHSEALRLIQLIERL